MSCTLISEIQLRAEETPDKPAFIFISQDRTRVVLTFNDVYDLGRKFAARLQKLGLQPGDVVCNTVANSPERLITQFGTLMAGCIDMNGQLSLADGTDFISSLNEGSAKAVIYNPHESTGAYTILKGRLKPSSDTLGEVECCGVLSLKKMIPCVLKTQEGDVMSFLDDLKLEHDSVFIDRGPDAMCTYMCTSGSTGFFKLVGFYAKRIVGMAHQTAHIFGLTRDSVLLNDRPLGWVGGYPSRAILVGCTRVVLDWTVSRQDEMYAKFFLEVARTEKCTDSFAVPLQFMNLIREAKNLYPNGDGYLLQSIAVGGGPLKRNILEGAGSVSKSVIPAYGSTEIGMTTSLSLTCKADMYDDFVCGYPSPGIEIKIVKTNNEEAKTSEVGDILIKPAFTSAGYISNEQANRDTFLPGGWVKLGDIGFIDAQGRLSVLGRGKNAIMRGPVVFYPDLTEACLQRCPGVESVAVVGVPDEGLFEEICALVVRLPTILSAKCNDNIETTIQQEKESSNIRIVDICNEEVSTPNDDNVYDIEKPTRREDIVAENPGTPETNKSIKNYNGTENDGISDRLTEEGVRKFCKDNLYLQADNNDFSPLPKYFIFVEALPKLHNGKLDRGAAKKMAASLVRTN